jgi:hypothetical protein
LAVEFYQATRDDKFLVVWPFLIKNCTFFIADGKVFRGARDFIFHFGVLVRGKEHVDHLSLGGFNVGGVTQDLARSTLKFAVRIRV